MAHFDDAAGSAAVRTATPHQCKGRVGASESSCYPLSFPKIRKLLGCGSGAAPKKVSRRACPAGRGCISQEEEKDTVIA
jgi:hypothetical protein